MKLRALESVVLRALGAVGTPSAGETLVVALSGGADSVALTDVLTTLSRRIGFRLVAAHLDHGLRPDSAEDAAFCARLCRELGLELRLGHADVRARSRRDHLSLEDAARRERYAFLRTVQKEEGAVAIAVAHTRDDQAETLLLRLLRGSGATGLSAMRQRRDDVIRPLLGVSRQAVRRHLATRRLGFREDPTNADPAYLRNRVRHELLPLLEARFNPRIRETLAQTASLLADEAALLGELADAVWQRAGRVEGGGGRGDAQRAGPRSRGPWFASSCAGRSPRRAACKAFRPCMSRSSPRSFARPLPRAAGCRSRGDARPRWPSTS